jgi:amidase
MPIRRPSAEDLDAGARAHYFDLTDQERESFLQIIDGTLSAYDRLDQLPEPKLPVRYPRLPGRRPNPDENPFGGWAWMCNVKGAADGPLAGKRIALKDTVAVAGVPLSNGSALMEGFIPDVDATLVTRILDAGGEIVGKAMCENMCFSGGSHTSHPWPVKNPHNPEFMASGSSSGSAALLASGACDMAIGADQGGSIREPASWCGVLGLKPTYGLVPYTGVLSLEPTLDHVGPMARTVSDLALLLEAIAGRDELDPRQPATLSRKLSFSRELEANVSGLRIGIVSEGFDWPQSEESVNALVRTAAQRLAELGASVKEIGVPMHKDGINIFDGVVIEGAWSTMIRGEGISHGSDGYYDTHAVEFFGRSRRARAHDFPTNVKLVTLLAHYLAERYHSRYYAKAQNLRRALRDAYDQALAEVDLLLLPTTPQRATRYEPELLIPTVDNIAGSLSMIHNTCPFDLTGHPALSVPCGFADGLPAGMMLVGRHFEDATLLRAAYAYEQAVGPPKVSVARDNRERQPVPAS